VAPTFRSAYLVHGDDHGRIAERRARLRALAERESGAQGLEIFEGESATPENVAAALNAMTLALGRRFIVVDGVERWRDRDLDDLERALGSIPEGTTVAFFAREDGRMKAPARLRQAIERVGGDISTESSLRPWELPKWAIARARELDLRLDPEAARALVAHVGERQQRLLRELEKLALELGPGASVDVERVQELTAASAERRAWTLADALLTGDRRAAIRALLQVRAQGERLPGLIWWMSARLRDAHRVARALEAGEPVSQVRRGLRMPPKAAEQLIADARRLGGDRLREAIEEIADLELGSRGGGRDGAGEDTQAVLAIRRITA
jgi:DNA polymerase-3 subunit delta